MTVVSPLPQGVAWRAVAGCFVKTFGMLARSQVHQPRRNVGRVISFADGTSGRVYRETTVNRPSPEDPCVLIVSFRLRGVRGAVHAAFRAESILNTVLFVGFPGFVSKLWMTNDENGVYRGLYEWDGPQEAEDYARALWRVLELVSSKGSIDFRVFPGLHRDDVLADPTALDGHGTEERAAWWRVTAA